MNGVANLALARESKVGEIAFIDLRAQQRLIRDKIESRIKRVLDHGRYIAGPEIEELEEALTTRTGAKVAVACASGTAALIIPLLAEGVGAGDAVFLPAFTYNATANAVLLAGATPVFVDIEKSTYNIDVEDLARKIEFVRREGRLKPRCVIPVDLFGAPADYKKIHEIAARENLFVLADAAQSFGGALGDKAVGNLAPATSTSFFPGKALGAYGDAGAVLGNAADNEEIWKSIRWHGTDESRKESVRVGFNGRMDSFQAAVLLEKLAIFDAELAARERIAAAYDEQFSDIARPQKLLDGAKSGRAYYCVRLKGRDDVAERLGAMGVPTAIYYSKPLHVMPAFADYAPQSGLPHTEQLSAEILALPMHPYLTPSQVDFICECVRTAVNQD